MSILTNLLRRFKRDEKGTVVVEAIMVVPMFIWAYAGLFSYWDMYRTINTAQKASYTISDLLSRTQGPVNNNYINGLKDTMNYILDDDQAGNIRVTSYRWSEPNNRYEVIFSRSTGGGMGPLNNGNLANLVNRLPIMADGDAAVLVETRVPYNPPMAFGLEPTNIEQFIVTRPRFLPKICHSNYTC